MDLVRTTSTSSLTHCSLAAAALRQAKNPRSASLHNFCQCSIAGFRLLEYTGHRYQSTSRSVVYQFEGGDSALRCPADRLPLRVMQQWGEGRGEVNQSLSRRAKCTLPPGRRI